MTTRTKRTSAFCSGKVALTARKVLPEQKAEARFWMVNWGGLSGCAGGFGKRAREGLQLWEVILPAPFWVGYEKKKRHINEEICRVRVR